MKKLIASLVLLTAVPVFGQIVNPRTQRFRVFSSDPSVCRKADVGFNTTTNLFKGCTATNTWSVLTSSGGGTFTGPILIADGTAAAPSLGFASDADGTGTGLFRGCANCLSITINGVEKFVFNASAALVCGTDGGCDIGNGASDPRDLSLQRSLILRGSTSGSVTMKAAAVAGSNTVTLPAGTTDFSATGGADFVLKQESAGAAITVAQLAAADLSNGTSGTGAVILASAPTLINPVANLGSGLGSGKISAVYATTVSAAGVGNTAATTDDPLWTLTALPANTLTTAGDALVFTLELRTAATANNKRIGITVGGNQVNTNTTSANAVHFGGRITVRFVDATHVNVQIICTGGAGCHGGSYNLAVADVTANTLALVVTGASPTTGAAGDVLLMGGQVNIVKQ